MGTLTFPTIKPSRISGLGPPDYRQNTIAFDDGNEQSIQFQTTGAGVMVSFVYDCLDATEVNSLMSFWRLVGGQSDSFFLPLSLLDYPTAITAALGNFGHSTKWKFAEPFAVENVVASSTRGVFQTTVKLRSVVV